MNTTRPEATLQDEANSEGDAMCAVSFRASGWSEEPEGDRPHHQLPQGALGAGRGRRQAVQHHLRPGRRRNGEHGRFSVLSRCMTSSMLEYKKIHIPQALFLEPLSKLHLLMKII